jgi:hypothetical protein
MASHISLPSFVATRRGLNVHRGGGSRIPADPFDKISVDNDYMSCKTALTQTIRPLTQRRILLPGRPMKPVCLCLSSASSCPPDLPARLRFLVRPQLLIRPTPVSQKGYSPVLPASRQLILILAGQGFLQAKRSKGSDHAIVRGRVKSATWRVRLGDVPEADASIGWCQR